MCAICIVRTVVLIFVAKFNKCRNKNGDRDEDSGPGGVDSVLKHSPQTAIPEPLLCP